MAHAIQFHQSTGPEVLRWEEVAVGGPGPGQVRLRHAAVELKFADIRIETNQRYPVENAARAHRDLDSRKKTGSSVLVV
jgi:NADPH2:quinone reductase